MRRLGLLASLGLAACLPAYDNMFMGVGGDGGMPGDDAAVDASAGSGKFVTGIVVNVEDVKLSPGITARFAGVDDPQFVSLPSDNAGHFKLEIPQALVTAKTPTYLIFEGTYLGKTILRTHYLPRMVMDGGSGNTGIATHFYRNQDDAMGVRGQIAKSLEVHGDIASAADFAANFSFMYGDLVQFSNLGFKVYRGYTIEISENGTVIDQTSCNPSVKCCRYYSQDYSAYIAAMPMPATMIDFAATSSPTAFAVVCPAGQTGDIGLKQTAPLNQIFDQSTGKSPTKPFPDITAPRIAGDGVLIFWQAPP